MDKVYQVLEFLIAHMAWEHGRMGAWARKPKAGCETCQRLGMGWN